jgi:hypothetical protein
MMLKKWKQALPIAIASILTPFGLGAAVAIYLNAVVDKSSNFAVTNF